MDAPATSSWDELCKRAESRDAWRQRVRGIRSPRIFKISGKQTVQAEDVKFTISSWSAKWARGFAGCADSTHTSPEHPHHTSHTHTHSACQHTKLRFKCINDITLCVWVCDTGVWYGCSGDAHMSRHGSRSLVKTHFKFFLRYSVFVFQKKIECWMWEWTKMKDY